MHWEEKIEVLKREIPDSDLKVPFNDWSNIFKQIESNFIKRLNSDYRFKNWSDNIKDCKLILTIQRSDIEQIIDRFDSKSNYWVVLPNDKQPTARQMIYDCKPYVIAKLIELTSNDFFVIDKKYKWMFCFNVDTDLDKINILQSGDNELIIK